MSGQRDLRTVADEGRLPQEELQATQRLLQLSLPLVQEGHPRNRPDMRTPEPWSSGATTSTL